MIDQIFNDHTIYALSWALLHSLWQIFIIAAVLKTLLVLNKNWQASTKYWIGLAALFTALGISLWTFLFYYNPSSGMVNDLTTVLSFNELATPLTQVSSLREMTLSFIDAQVKVIGNLWMIGGLIFLLRFIFGLSYVRYLYLSAEVQTDRWINKLSDTIKTGMELWTPTLIAESKVINSPMVIGIIKPMILFPIGMLNQLEVREVELILAHELAHIKRHDFLVNLLQNLVETLLYFNPFIWYISGIIKEEREHCCDDYALSYSDTNLNYVKVLLRLQECRQETTPNLAMAFSDGSSGFYKRINRILNIPTKQSFMKERIFTLVLVALIFAAFTKNFEPKEERLELDRIESLSTLSSIQPELARLNLSSLSKDLDTLPNNRRVETYKIKKDDETFSLQILNGEVKSFSINGRRIHTDELEKKGKVYYYNGEEIVDVSEVPTPPKPPSSTRSKGEREVQIFSFSDEMEHMNIDSMLKNNMGIFSSKGLRIDSLLNNTFSRIIVEGDMELPEGLGNGDIRTFFFDGENFEGAMDSMSNNFQMFKFDMDSDFPEGLDLDSMLAGENSIQFRQFFKDEDGFDEDNFEDLFSGRSSSVSDKLTRELNKDGLLELNKNNEVELSGKHLKINGDKQPTNIYHKYKRLYEEWMGAPLNKDSKIKMDIHGKRPYKKLRRL